MQIISKTTKYKITNTKDGPTTKPRRAKTPGWFIEFEKTLP